MYSLKRNPVQTTPTVARKNRKKLILAVILLAILIVGVSYASFRIYSIFRDTPAGTKALSLSQYWGTFYYPWYCNASCPSPDTWRHWNGCPCDNPASPPYNPPKNWASRFLPDDGSSTFNPTSQLYSSQSATVINRDLTWMDDARLDFALVSWWGQNSFEDNASRLMLVQARNNATLHMKLAVYYELDGVVNGKNADPTVSQIVSDLTYVYENRANFSSYFKIGPNHLPMVFVYADLSDIFDYAGRWSMARSLMMAKGEPMFIVLKTFGGYSQNATAVDGWYQYRPDVNATSTNSFPHYELQPGYSALATPGFWSYREASSRLNRNATGFALAVRTMASLPPSGAQFLLIETFNEWHEGTQVEPGIPVNTGAISFTQAEPSYGFTYLDIIRNRGQII